MTKMKTIRLTRHVADVDRSNSFSYRVVTITDSVEFGPGDVLTKKQVEGLCSAKDWKVTVANAA